MHDSSKFDDLLLIPSPALYILNQMFRSIVLHADDKTPLLDLLAPLNLAHLK